MSLEKDNDLLECATRAAQRAADPDAVEKALHEMHERIFAPAVAAGAQASNLLTCIHDARAAIESGSGEAKNDLNTGRLLLEAVLALGEMLVNAAQGQRSRGKVVRRLEDVVLPILFIRSGVTAPLLKAHALTAPWATFDAACADRSREVEKLELTFASWNARHAWNFLSDKERRRVTSNVAASPPGEGKALPEKTEQSVAAAAPTPPSRAALRDISWNAALKRGAGGGIPSYLLTKRRRMDGDPPMTDARAPLPAASPSQELVPSKPHTTIESLDAKADSHIFAVKSPVRRRRIDFNVGIPPSPDRPGRCL